MYCRAFVGVCLLLINNIHVAVCLLIAAGPYVWKRGSPTCGHNRQSPINIINHHVNFGCSFNPTFQYDHSKVAGTFTNNGNQSADSTGGSLVPERRLEKCSMTKDCFI